MDLQAIKTDDEKVLEVGATAHLLLDLLCHTLDLTPVRNVAFIVGDIVYGALALWL